MLRPRKLFLGTVALAMMVIGGGVVLGQIWGVPWDTLIHCSGSGQDGDQPTMEFYTEAGEGVNQCHGMPGQTGQCSFDQLDADMQVTCWVTPSGTEKCYAEANCPDGERLFCGGANNHTFAGTVSHGNDIYAYVNCETTSGTVIFSDLCQVL